MFDGTTRSAYVIKAILRCFELVSGLRVNFCKTRIGGLGLDAIHLNNLSSILNCKHMKIPFLYLGLPIGGDPRKKQFWQTIVSKVKSRLSSWKGKLLSMTGRVCLIKSIISALPLYYLSFFKAPKCVCDELKKIQRNFLCGWSIEDRKIA